MDKIRIRQNYENYERVQKAFKEFIHALVWESMDIDAGVHEDEVNEHIDKYCRTNGDQMIALTNDSVTKFIKSLNSRFEVHCYEIDANELKGTYMLLDEASVTGTANMSTSEHL